MVRDLGDLLQSSAAPAPLRRLAFVPAQRPDAHSVQSDVELVALNDPEVRRGCLSATDVRCAVVGGAPMAGSLVNPV
jgi:hypothetical protein